MRIIPLVHHITITSWLRLNGLATSNGLLYIRLQTIYQIFVAQSLIYVLLTDTSDNAKMIFLCATVFALLSLTSASPGVTVDTQNVINQVEARYLSYTLDSYLLSTIPKFNIFPFK